MIEYLKKMSFIPKTSKIFSGAIVVGDVAIGNNCGIYYNAVIRGDSCSIKILDDTNIQDNCVIHGEEGFNVRVGKGCTIGHSAILHGCTVGDNTCVGMGAILLNGTKIGNDCMVGAGSVVSAKLKIPDGHLVIGNPAIVKRPLTEKEILKNRELAQHYKSLLDNFSLYNAQRQ